MNSKLLSEHFPTKRQNLEGGSRASPPRGLRKCHLAATISTPSLFPFGESLHGQTELMMLLKDVKPGGKADTAAQTPDSQRRRVSWEEGLLS